MYSAAQFSDFEFSGKENPFGLVKHFVNLGLPSRNDTDSEKNPSLQISRTHLGHGKIMIAQSLGNGSQRAAPVFQAAGLLQNQVGYQGSCVDLSGRRTTKIISIELPN